MFMKKFVIALLLFIAILLVILFLKITGVIVPSSQESKVANTSTSSTYSHEDIVNLILKGKDNLNNMQNVYYEAHSYSTLSKYYHKGNKRKKELYFEPSKTSSVAYETLATSSFGFLDEKKSYYFNHIHRTLSTSKISTLRKWISRNSLGAYK